MTTKQLTKLKAHKFVYINAHFVNKRKKKSKILNYIKIHKSLTERNLFQKFVWSLIALLYYTECNSSLNLITIEFYKTN